MRRFSIQCSGAWTHDETLVVEALAPGAPGDLEELTHPQHTGLGAVVLAELREQHRPDGHVDADAEGVGATDQLQQTLLGELLDEQAVAGQQAGVMDADAGHHEAAEVLADGTVETKAADGLAQRLLLVGRQDVEAGQRLRRGHRLGLGEVHEIHRGAPELQQLGERLVLGSLAVLELEGHRTSWCW